MKYLIGAAFATGALATGYMANDLYRAWQAPTEFERAVAAEQAAAECEQSLACRVTRDLNAAQQ